jgi:hypothetical protein
MANTTNYNWETPDDTDLVKDGAAAIRTLGSSIDTTTKALNPSTTLGDIEYRSSTANTNARLGIGSNGQILGVSAGVPAWINNDQGDITEVAAGTGISVASGTGPIPTVSINTAVTADLTTAQTLTNKTLTSPVLTTPSLSTIDAKGDLIVGTADNTIGRLAVGTNGHTLVADSAEATGLKWQAPASGGGMTLINTGGNTLSGASTTVSTIPGTYNDLIVYVVDFYAAGNFYPFLLINGDSTAANYQQFVARGAGSSNGTYVDNSTSGMDMSGYQIVAADNNNFISIYIPNYANTVSRKMANSLAGYQANTSPSASKGVTNNTTNYLGSTLNITSLEFKCSGSTWSGGTVYVYGVK